MRSRFLLLAFLVFPLAIFAADLKITVTDPQSALVAGARVSVYLSGGSAPVAVATTAGEGRAEFRNLATGRYRVEVLAPGFAPASAELNVEGSAALKLTLAIAVPSQSVVVTATRTPTPLEESGASVAQLTLPALTAMQPITVSEALRFMPGAVVNTAGQRGGQASLFVRGGESRYNKVIVDGVPVNEPGGVFDFGVVPMFDMERVEMLRGPGSVLYGSDAMTSVAQFWTRTGSTRIPELRFGADGGTFATGRGYASLAGAGGRFDYNLFGEQFNTEGQGINDTYSNSAQGANLGVGLAANVALRVRMRHANSRTGVQGAWDFNGVPRLAPDVDAFARQNNFLGSAVLTITASPQWQHRFSGYEYNHRGLNRDTVPDRGCDVVNFNFFDCFFSASFSINRAGFEYQGDYSPRAWLHTTVGYDFEDENGFFDSRFVTLDMTTNPPSEAEAASHTHGLRRNHALYVNQTVIWKRLLLVGGVRYVHNESFGDTAVPQVSGTVLVARGRDVFSGTRLRGMFARAIQEPSFQESFGITSTSFPLNGNPDLKPEKNRSFEAGFEQLLFGGKASLNATYFHNLFRDQIAFASNPELIINDVPCTLPGVPLPPPAEGRIVPGGCFVNINQSVAHGAEVEWHSRVRSTLMLSAGYVYTSSQILKAPTAFGFPNLPGEPLLRRPKHFGTLLLAYAGRRWGGSVGGSFVGRRLDSDFLDLVPPVTYAAGYARVDLGGWYALNHRVTLYAQMGNALDAHYEEAVGYPALKANFRAGMRFRVGGD